MDPYYWLENDYAWDCSKCRVVKNGVAIKWEDVPESVRHKLKLAGFILPTGLGKVLHHDWEITKRIHELAEKINEDYKNIEEPLILVGILKGSFILMADLVRQLKIPHVVDFMAVSSYGDKTESDGNVRIIMDCRVNQRNRDVLIVEDIVDSGYTLDYIANNFKSRNTKSVKTVTLLDKPAGRKVDFKADYVGFELEGDEWVVGYGLDAGEKWRTLPYIATIER